MNTTIQATIPVEIKHEMDKAIANGRFSSVNEAVKAALSVIFPNKKHRRLTINGFTQQFESEVLEAEKEPLDQAIEWDGKGSSVEFALKHAK